MALVLEAEREVAGWDRIRGKSERERVLKVLVPGFRVGLGVKLTPTAGVRLGRGLLTLVIGVGSVSLSSWRRLFRRSLLLCCGAGSRRDPMGCAWSMTLFRLLTSPVRKVISARLARRSSVSSATLRVWS